jgi:hypothetical protein
MNGVTAIGEIHMYFLDILSVGMPSNKSGRAIRHASKIELKITNKECIGNEFHSSKAPASSSLLFPSVN